MTDLGCLSIEVHFSLFTRRRSCFPFLFHYWLQSKIVHACSQWLDGFTVAFMVTWMTVYSQVLMDDYQLDSNHQSDSNYQLVT